MVNSIFLYVILLIIPSVMVIYGAFSWYMGLKNREFITSYKTKRAKKDKETWMVANTFFGRLMTFLGIILFISVFISLWYLGTIEALNGFTETVIILIEALCFLASFYLTELKLERDEKRKGESKKEK